MSYLQFLNSQKMKTLRHMSVTHHQVNNKLDSNRDNLTHLHLIYPYSSQIPNFKNKWKSQFLHL
jgi:hypothetical protein